jgi:hypothetical protein
VQGIWKCVGAESGTVFSEVDLSEGEWTDYDEKVGIFDYSFPLLTLCREVFQLVS